MTAKRNTPIGAKILMGWWIVVIVFGLFGNFWMAFKSLDANNFGGFALFCGLGVGCGVLCFRTYKGWDELIRGW
ncbi:hypothetical protein [Bradyrhizobium canariense]|uniref:hypothetical protein n=1 Tax=Bradyrhizobium canariense TaxID=255045 RepID=UPI001FE66066|nr:hypothetical protein [Bradyrhizobium canariense]